VISLGSTSEKIQSSHMDPVLHLHEGNEDSHEHEQLALPVAASETGGPLVAETIALDKTTSWPATSAGAPLGSLKSSRTFSATSSPEQLHHAAHMLLVLHSSQIQVGRFLEVLTQMLDEASQTAGDEEQNGAYLRVFHFFTQMFRKLLAEQQQSTSANSFNFNTTTPARPSAAVVEAGVPLPALSVSATTSASSGDDLEFLKARPLMSTASAAGARTGRGVPAGVVLSASTSEDGMNKGKSSNPQAPESWSSPTPDDKKTCSEVTRRAQNIKAAAGSTTSLQQFRQQLLTTTHLLPPRCCDCFQNPH